MAENIENETLISLVQLRPVLWDKTLDIYKDRNATKKAWREICFELNKDFDDMEDLKKNDFGMAVMRRWANLRDAFTKSIKKIQHSNRRGGGKVKVRKYVYHDRMQFLSKLYDADGLENTPNSEEGLADNEQPQQTSGAEESLACLVEVTCDEKNSESLVNRKRRKRNQEESKFDTPMEHEVTNFHMSFFQGVMPHLTKFDDSEVLEFQMGVLQVIANINEKRSRTQPPSGPYHQQFTDISGYLHPSCSSHFNTPTSYRPSYSYRSEFCNFQNKNNQKKKNFRMKKSKSRSRPSTEKFVQNYSLEASSPDTDQRDSPSPSPSGSSQNTVDFTT